MGNVRLSYSDLDNSGDIDKETEILEENNYYPFGLKHRGYNEIVNAETEHKFRFNSTEFDADFDLNWYNMPLRHQDPTTGRWNGIDPVTHFSSSTYAGYNNNPVFWADPSGADFICAIRTGIGVALSNPYVRGGLRLIKIGNKVRKFQQDDSKKLKKAKVIRDKYLQMINKAREDGHDVAADHLQKFLDGSGGIQEVNEKWLKTFDVITDAEERIFSYFENSLEDLAKEMKDGETITHTDYWKAALSAPPWTELYYASGKSQITSRGNFSLTRKGDTIYISGTIVHQWNDPYNWNKGEGAYIPGFGGIRDKDGLLVQQELGAKPFQMQSTWSTNHKTSGKLRLGGYFISIDLK